MASWLHVFEASGKADSGRAFNKTACLLLTETRRNEKGLRPRDLMSF